MKNRILISFLCFLFIHHNEGHCQFLRYGILSPIYEQKPNGISGEVGYKKYYFNNMRLELGFNSDHLLSHFMYKFKRDIPDEFNFYYDLRNRLILIEQYQPHTIFKIVRDSAGLLKSFVSDSNTISFDYNPDSTIKSACVSGCCITYKYDNAKNIIQDNDTCSISDVVNSQLNKICNFLRLADDFQNLDNHILFKIVRYVKPKIHYTILSFFSGSDTSIRKNICIETEYPRTRKIANFSCPGCDSFYTVQGIKLNFGFYGDALGLTKSERNTLFRSNLKVKIYGNNDCYEKYLFFNYFETQLGFSYNVNENSSLSVNTLSELTKLTNAQRLVLFQTTEFLDLNCKLNIIKIMTRRKPYEFNVGFWEGVSYVYVVQQNLYKNYPMWSLYGEIRAELIRLKNFRLCSSVQSLSAFHSTFDGIPRYASHYIIPEVSLSFYPDERFSMKFKIVQDLGYLNSSNRFYSIQVGLSPEIRIRKILHDINPAWGKKREKRD